MTTSKGTIQGYNGIAINDDKHQIILQAQAWGSVGEQQTLKPAVEQLNNQLDKLGTSNTFSQAKFTADSGFHSEVNLKFIATTGLDSYIADTGFRSRNPLFQVSETYQTEKEKRRLKRSKGKPRKFSSDNFYFDKTAMTCRCPAGKDMWLQSKNIQYNGKAYVRFTGYLKNCKVCPLRAQCMKNPLKGTGRQVQFVNAPRTEFISYTDKMKDKQLGRKRTEF